MEKLDENLLGQQFRSFEELQVFMADYQTKTKQVFTIKTSEKCKESTSQLVYKKIHYQCKFGGKCRTESTGVRKTSTFKLGCESFIKLSLTRDHRFLEIKKTNLLHTHHSQSMAFHAVIPENRRLSPQSKQEAMKLLELGCNKKMLQSKIMREQKKAVTLKDLSNLKAALKTVDDEDLPTAVKMLETEYGATVKVLAEDNRFKGLFFVTEDMKKSMAAWPDITLLDGTYKLLKTGLTLMLLIVQDSNALSAVVGVGLLANEDRPTFQWFLQSFKDLHVQATSRMQCFMGDKDLLERDVLKEVFPGIPVYICRFHTLRTFSRVITTDKMNISKAERNTSLRLLEKLVYSSSEKSYDKLYNEFQQSVPSSVKEYFDCNWHPIRSDWTTYSMVCGNLGNFTNNRLESMNSKIKQVVPKNSSLVGFIRSFFIWLESHNEEVDLKTAYVFLKRPVETLRPDSDEQQYKDVLMPPAFVKVFAQIQELKYVTNITCNDQSSKACFVRSNNTELNVTPSSCQCAVWTWDLLPCRHIFAVRRYFGLPLFEEGLCQPRCTKQYVVENQRCFRSSQETYDAENDNCCPMISKVTPRKPITVTEKRKKVAPLTNELLNLASLSCGPRFDAKIDLLTQICDLWRQGHEVQILRTGESHSNASKTTTENENVDAIPKMVSDAFNSLCEELESRCSLTESSTVLPGEVSVVIDGDLSEIKMPEEIKIVGRPSRYLSTTNGCVRSKKMSTRFSDKRDEDQIRDILSWLVKSSMIDSTIKQEYLIRTTDLQLESLKDSLLHESVDLNRIKVYFEPIAFKKLTKCVQTKKLKKEFICDWCQKKIIDKSVTCDHCLLQSHYQCVGFKRAPRAAKWFCPRCLPRRL